MLSFSIFDCNPLVLLRYVLDLVTIVHPFTYGSCPKSVLPATTVELSIFLIEKYSWLNRHSVLADVLHFQLFEVQFYREGAFSSFRKVFYPGCGFAKIFVLRFALAMVDVFSLFAAWCLSEHEIFLVTTIHNVATSRCFS